MINKTLEQKWQYVVDRIMYETRELLVEKEFDFKQINYVLLNHKELKKSIVSVCDKNFELYDVILKEKEIKDKSYWTSCIDEDIFQCIENEYNLGFMNIDMHITIWNEIENVGIDKFTHKIGLQKYLKYCKENNITKEYLEEKTNKSIPNVMKYYKEQNNYITVEDGQVIMPKGLYQKEMEISYIAFSLGYDLLQNVLSNSEVNECDSSFDYCDYLARKFVETDYYKDTSKSLYDKLYEWVNDNIDIIKSEYLYYFDVDDKYIIAMEKNKDTPIALLERKVGDDKEYIVTLGYKITNKETICEYSFKYGNDFEKAKKDFKRAIAGEDLLKENKEKKHKERER